MGESYSTTPLLSLLLRANYPAHAVCPFFVILDEMNLSYVEMYFSRFLSLMETLTGGQPEAVLEPSELRLLLRSAPSAVEATYIEHAITSVGTVNVDETTHMFSPKVLDRAFVLEFPTMLPSQKPDEFAIASTDAVEGSVSDFWRYLAESCTIAPSKEDDAFLDAVYEKLERFQFGPRVTTEAQRYLAAVKTLATIAKCADEFSSTATVRDRVLMQKILPKLHGNRSVENVDYTFSIVVPMPKADFEQQSKRAGDGIFPFHNLKLKGCITFNGPDSCRMLNSERCVVTGRLKFDNQLGGVDFSLRKDIADLQLRAEVTSNKLDYEQDFQELLGQLAELHAEIILNLDAPTEMVMVTGVVLTRQSSVRISVLKLS
jgi:hypothetical protein